MNGKELLIGLSYINRKYIDESEKEFPVGQSQAPEAKTPQKQRPRRKIWLIAAAAALTLLLVGCAVVVYSRIQMKVVQHHVPTTTTVASVSEASAAGEPEPVRDPLTSCYPQALPAGYQMGEGEQMSHHTRRIEYRNDDGKTISFHISTYEPMNITLAPPAEKVTMTVSGYDALMQVKENAAQAFTWHNEAEGYYASLFTEDMAVDLHALAEGVDYGEALPLTFLCKEGKVWKAWYPQQLPEEPSLNLGPDYTIELEQEKSTYVAWEPVYPQWVPVGYEISFVSDPAYGQQTIYYENPAEEEIIYTFYFRLGQWGRQFDGMGQPEELTIAGHPGYRLGNKLIWTDEAKGFGFELVGMPGVDLIAIAESVGHGPELEPTNADKTEKALAELGNYQITALPEGMVEDALTGLPLEDGGAWYSYVRRWYIDPNTNAQIYFTYESYAAADDQRDITLEEIAKAQIGDIPLELCTIQGCAGAVSQDGESAKAVWIMGNETKGVSFSLYSTDYSAQELLTMAQSVQKK